MKPTIVRAVDVVETRPPTSEEVPAGSPPFYMTVVLTQTDHHRAQVVLTWKAVEQLTACLRRDDKIAKLLGLPPT